MAVVKKTLTAARTSVSRSLLSKPTTTALKSGIIQSNTCLTCGIAETAFTAPSAVSSMTGEVGLVYSGFGVDPFGSEDQLFVVDISHVDGMAYV